MEYLKLELKYGKVIDELKKGVFSKDFFYPFNYKHVYNMLCTLMDKTPTPQNRVVNTKYMPFYKNIEDVVKEGYVKIYCVSSHTIVTAVKGSYNSNAKNDAVKQITWKDCEEKMGENFKIFKEIIKEDFKIDYNEGYLMGFETIMNIVVKCGNIKLLTDLKKWFKQNNLTVFINYIENHPDYKGDYYNKKTEFVPSQINKRVYRGILNSQVYNATFYIPFSDELKKEYLEYSKGWTTMLDGGLVEAIGFVELYQDDIINYLEIKDLLPLRKSVLLNNKIVDFTKFDEYKLISKKIKNSKSVLRIDIIALLNILNLNYDKEDLIKFFKNKKIEEKTVTGLIKNIHNRNFWSINKVENIYKNLNLEYTYEDLVFKNGINSSSVNYKIEKLISNKIK